MQGCSPCRGFGARSPEKRQRLPPTTACRRRNRPTNGRVPLRCRSGATDGNANAAGPVGQLRQVRPPGRVAIIGVDLQTANVVLQTKSRSVIIVLLVLLVLLRQVRGRAVAGAPACRQRAFPSAVPILTDRQKRTFSSDRSDKSDKSDRSDRSDKSAKYAGGRPHARQRDAVACLPTTPPVSAASNSMPQTKPRPRSPQPPHGADTRDLPECKAPLFAKPFGCRTTRQTRRCEGVY